MADRIFKGKLTPEVSEAFSESATAFDKRHAGGLVPFEQLKDVLLLGVGARKGRVVNLKPRLEDCRTTFKMVGESIFMTQEDVWIKIDPDGTIEIGIAGA